MTESIAKPDPSSNSKWLIILLVVSLIVNLLFAGVFIWRCGFHKGSAGGHMMRMRMGDGMDMIQLGDDMEVLSMRMDGMGRGMKHGMKHGMRQKMSSHMLQGLSPELQEKLKSLMKQQKDSAKKFRTELENIHQKVHDIVISESLDKEALQQALMRFRELRSNRQSRKHKLIGEVLAGVSDIKQRETIMRRFVFKKTHLFAAGNRHSMRKYKGHDMEHDMMCGMERGMMRGMEHGMERGMEHGMEQ